MLGSHEAFIAANRFGLGARPGELGAIVISKVSGALIQRTLSFGQVGNKNSDSAAVLEAQKMLTKLGYDLGKIDGVYGRKTKAAIEEFEARTGKQPTGDV